MSGYPVVSSTSADMWGDEIPMEWDWAAAQRCVRAALAAGAISSSPARRELPIGAPREARGHNCASNALSVSYRRCMLLTVGRNRTVPLTHPCRRGRGAPLVKTAPLPAASFEASTVLCEHEPDDRCQHCLVHHGMTHKLKNRAYLPRPWHAYPDHKLRVVERPHPKHH